MIKIAERFIKTYEKILDWEWFDNPKMVSVWITCLVMANWKDGEYHGVKVPRGSFVTSYEHLSTITGISKTTIRNCLKRLENGNQIVLNSERRWTTISIVNYDKYQSFNDEVGTITEHKRISNGFQTDFKRISNGTNSRIIEYKNNRMKESVKESADALPSHGTQGGLCERFNEFWEMYPNKKYKDRTMDIWASQGLDAKADEIIANVKERIQYGDHDSNSLTYLENEEYKIRADKDRASY